MYARAPLDLSALLRLPRPVPLHFRSLPALPDPILILIPIIL